MNRIACALVIFGSWSAAMGCGAAKRSSSQPDPLCEPGVKSCSGRDVEVCSDEGTARSVIQTCSQTDVCRDGECQSVDCIPGRNFCQDGSVWTCGRDGVEPLQSCQAGETCQVVGGTAVCVPPPPSSTPGAPQMCEAGSKSCDESRVIRCNDLGGGWETTTDCAATGASCVAGECQSADCKPNAMFCGDDGNVYRCSDDGKSSSRWLTCAVTSFRCIEFDPDTAGCDYESCAPLEVGCDENTIKTCTAEGKWPAQGTDCASDQYCKSGACVDRFCDPGAIFCQDNDIYACSSLGDLSAVLLECPSDSECHVETFGFVCRPFPCPKGQTMCLGDRAGSCADDGQSLAAISADCAAEGLLCSPSHTCASTAIDSLGGSGLGGVISDEIQSTNSIVGNVVETNTSRMLTEMQLDMVLNAPHELRWCVFELTPSLDLELKQEWRVSAPAGNGFSSSGPISFKVEAGKTYLFGVAFGDGPDAITTVEFEPFERQLSFGRIVGDSQNEYAAIITYPSIGDVSVYLMKLSTTPVAIP